MGNGEPLLAATPITPRRCSPLANSSWPQRSKVSDKLAGYFFLSFSLGCFWVWVDTQKPKMVFLVALFVRTRRKKEKEIWLWF
jgi:hypothetical protein